MNFNHIECFSCKLCGQPISLDPNQMVFSSFELCQNCYSMKNVQNFGSHSFESVPVQQHFSNLTPSFSVNNYGNCSRGVELPREFINLDFISNQGPKKLRTKTHLLEDKSDEELNGVWVKGTNSENMLYFGCFPINILAFNENESTKISEVYSKILQESNTQSPNIEEDLIEPYEIISYEIKRDLVDLYFKYHHPVFPILNKEKLNKDLDSRTINKTLLNAICAIAYWYVFEDELNFNKRIFPKQIIDTNPEIIINHFESQARFYLNESFSTLDIQTIQALLLLARNPMNSIASSKTWLYSGMATRMAMDMGLNKSIEHDSDIHSSEIQTMKSVWWGCFVLDSMFSLILCRPLSIQLNQCDIGFPDYENDPSMTFFCQGIQLTIIAARINHLLTSSRLNSTLQDKKNRAADCIVSLEEWKIKFFELCSTNETIKNSAQFIDNGNIKKIEHPILYNYYYFFVMIAELVRISDESLKINPKEDTSLVNKCCTEIIRHHEEHTFYSIIGPCTKACPIFFCSLVCIYHLKRLFRECSTFENIRDLKFWYKNLASCFSTMKIMKTSSVNLDDNYNKYTNIVRNENALFFMKISIDLIKYLNIPLSEINDLENYQNQFQKTIYTSNENPDTKHSNNFYYTQNVYDNLLAPDVFQNNQFLENDTREHSSSNGTQKEKNDPHNNGINEHKF